MNILLAVLGSYGDIYPMVGIGDRLRKRGHRVTLFTSPFFENLARKYGLAFVPIGAREQYERFAGHPDLFDPRKSLAVFFRILIIPGLRDSYERLCEHALQPDTVMVSSITALSARLVQEKHRIPNATVHLTPMAFKSAYEMPRNAMFSFPNGLPLSLKRLYWRVADAAVVDPLIRPALNALQKEIGLPPSDRILTRWGHSPQMVIGMFPGWYGAPQPDWPPSARLTGFPLFDEGQEAELDPEVEAFLDGGDPPVVFMPGSLMRGAERIFRTAVRACRELNRRAVLLSRYDRHIPGPLPEGIRHFRYVPLGRILPRTAALVHHGGIGSCAQAFRAGVPQLIHPMAYDQFDNAGRVARLGAGNWLKPRDWRAQAVAEKIRQLASSETVRGRCRSIAAAFRGTDALTDTAGLIESMAG